MLDNLKAEIARFGFTAKDVAIAMEASYDTATNKISGKREFTRREMFLIKDALFPFASIDYLFAYEPMPKKGA